MKLFTKGREYNNLAKAFNGMFVMINELEVKVTNRNNNEEFNEELLISAYLCRKNILDILEEYNWPIFSPIIIPMMSKGTVTLDFAHQQTVIRLIRISQILNR